MKEETYHRQRNQSLGQSNQACNMDFNMGHDNRLVTKTYRYQTIKTVSMVTTAIPHVSINMRAGSDKDLHSNYYNIHDRQT